MAAIDQNFELWSGNHATLTIPVLNAAGAVVPITGAAIKWVLSKAVDSAALVTKTVGAGVTITNGAGGIFTVALLPADTSSLWGIYYHEAEVTDGSGNIVTVLTGQADIQPTRAS